MEDVYLIRIKEFEPEHQLFYVCFNSKYEYIPEGRKITTCTVIEMPSKKVYAGATIKNINDLGNCWIGNRWAFKRAVFFMWMVWSESGKNSMAFNCFWQLFRKALSENQLYLKERKEYKNG